MPNSRSKLERAVESALFASRWFLAPLYLGMALALAMIIVIFARELINELAHIRTLDAEGGILMSLSLIDLSLTGNLAVMDWITSKTGAHAATQT